MNLSMLTVKPLLYAIGALLVLCVMLIVDLDRPRRGLVQVSQQSMLDAQQDLEAAVLPVAGD